ncbi:MAG: PAS domain-containing protein, partial [Myxococcales bacterium]|nr:PAS domain-containing protein [Myxococcales bacterium]
MGTGALVQAGGLTGVRFAVVGLVSALFAQIVSEASARASMAVLRPLTDAAKRIHEGEASFRALGSNEEAESRELGQALDKLAASLTTTLKELRAERDLVSGVLEGMQEGVMLLDASGNVALMNPAFREMLLVRGDMVGMPLLEVVRHSELKELFDKARKV